MSSLHPHFHAAPQPATAALPSRLAADEFALLVNAHARGFKRAMAAGSFDAIPRRQLFVSHSVEESERLVADAVDQGFRALFACGGDGSVSRLLNDLRSVVPDPERQPAVGLLRMGTGNALADYLGAGKAEQDLGRLLQGTSLHASSLGLLEIEGMLSPFAGCGVDARILNDYITLRQRVSGSALESVVTGVRGYLLSGILKTAPEMMVPSNRRRVYAINEGANAYAINARGEVVERYGAGALLYSGDVLLASAGSIPYYGYRLRMFPSAAELPGYFQLRLGMMHPALAVARLGKLWRGELGREHGVHDFMVQKVRLEFDGEVPFHVSGDAIGYRREMSFQLADRRFAFVRPS